MGLGAEGRKALKGKPVDHYLEQLKNVRQHTIDTFKTLDDDWLMEAEPFFPLSPGVQGQTNNYCKWFHVCEHESNHNGQIKFIKKRFDT